MILRNRLKERRAALNVNQQEMGRLCGVSRQTISLIERGDYSPSVTLALTIAKVCGVAVEEVFYSHYGNMFHYRRNNRLLLGKIRAEHAGGRNENRRNVFWDIYRSVADVSGSGNCAGGLRSYLSKRNKTTCILGRRK